MAYGNKKKKSKGTRAKEMKPKECSSCGETQHNVPKSVEQSKKIKPKEVFGSNYTKGQSKSDTSKSNKGSKS